MQWFGYGRTMKEGPNIASIAALIGDPARANMLIALMDGRALTATELSLEAGVTKQTASSHLSKLLAAQLLKRDIQGRHKYYKLADQDVANALETLMGVAARGAGQRMRTGPKEPALRKSRICYDHLAGELGVFMLDAMLSSKWILKTNDTYSLSDQGQVHLIEFGIDFQALKKKKRPLCKSCLDWSLRRHHLAGSVGAALLDQIFLRKWAKRVEGTRVIQFSISGEKAFKNWMN